MAVDLHALINPAHTVLVIQECQRGVIGDESLLPDLAAAARGTMIANVATLVEAARAAGVPVIHCTAERRPDAMGANTNARMFQAMARAPVQLTPGSNAAEIVPEIKLAPSDLVLPRLHGFSAFQGTELDSILRNLGTRTIVGVGVSVNIGITNLALDAVNAAYQMVIPRDAVAGFPSEYVEAVFEHALGLIATLVTAADLLDIWRG